MSDRRPKIIIVCNSSTLTEELLALNFDLFGGDAAESVQSSALPTELMLVPAGSYVTGRDGRSWGNNNPQRIIDFFAADGLDIPVDIEHATHLKAPRGEAAPAQAWVKSLRIAEDGSVWGSIEWTHEGAELVSGKSYRYYSPAYAIENASGSIAGIKSIGLTNKPNLNVSALNHQHQKGTSMNLVALLAALGLAPTATFDEALNSITKLKGDLTLALNASAAPPLDKFVPKADYDLALNRATEAEDRLAEKEKAALETAINSEIQAALAAGKITPATQEYHIAQCRQEGGLERFKQFVAAAPSVADNVELNRDKLNQDTALNAEEQAACKAMGITEEEYRKANA